MKVLLNFGLFHWLGQRISACCIVLSMVSIWFLNLPILNGILFVIIAYHLKFGLECLIDDYIHIKQLKMLGLTFLRLILLFLLHAVFLLFVF